MSFSQLLLTLPTVAWSVTWGADNQSGAANHYWQCDRQCRERFGFFNRSVSGTLTRGEISKEWCTCHVSGAQLGTAPYEHTGTPVTTGAGTFDNAQPFDDEYWCDTYSTHHLCVHQAIAGATPESLDCEDRPLAACAHAASSRGLTVLHCGQCGACSGVDDIRVLFDTRKDITTEMTSCAKSFALSNILPFGGRQGKAELVRCLQSKGINFSTDGRAWAKPAQLPTCMDCWVDNILNDKVLCTKHCLRKFIDPRNNRPYEKDGCLQCDEYTSGPAFIKCAGANRRASGIVSDIDRGPGQICPVGFCSGKNSSCFS